MSTIELLGRCSRCGRRECRADSLGRRAQKLGMPEFMRKEVTEAQDDCDAYRKAKHRKN